MGKTDAVLDIIGANFDQRPAPLMYVGPNKSFLETEVEPRIMEMIAAAPNLKERASSGKRMTKFRKVLSGVPLRLAWAGSATSLAAMAAKIRLVDELDRMVADVKKEGDPLTLVEARGMSCRDAKLGIISTPLSGVVDVVLDEVSGLELWKVMEAEDVASPIWKQFQAGTMFHWCWPCPHCADYFVPRFKQLVIPEGASAARAKREAFVMCPRCGGEITNDHKADMNARGRYVAPGQTVSHDGVVSGDPPESLAVTYWVSGLASPFRTFGERAASYVAAKLSGSQEKLQGVMNTGFGELFTPGGGDVPEWQQVRELRQAYNRLELPDGVRRITCAVDVQKNRLIYVVRGWGAQATSWLLDYGELVGPTTGDEVWNDLATLITTPIADMPIHKVVVDSGFRPGRPDTVPVNKVYEFCRRFPRVVSPSKGRQTASKPITVSRIEVTTAGTTRPIGLDLLLLDTDHWKSTVHERVKWPLGNLGAWMLPADVDDDYCKQIVSEARVKTPSGAPQWVQRARENHYLDCEAMAAAAAWMLGVHRIKPRAADPQELPPATTEDEGDIQHAGSMKPVNEPDKAPVRVPGGIRRVSEIQAPATPADTPPAAVIAAVQKPPAPGVARRRMSPADVARLFKR